MVNLAHTSIGILILFIFAVSLLNPGGGVVALFIALLIIGGMLFVPFMQDYVLSVNKGKAARKKPDMPEKDSGGGGRK